MLQCVESLLLILAWLEKSIANFSKAFAVAPHISPARGKAKAHCQSSAKTLLFVDGRLYGLRKNSFGVVIRPCELRQGCNERAGLGVDKQCIHQVFMGNQGANVVQGHRHKRLQHICQVGVEGIGHCPDMCCVLIGKATFEQPHQLQINLASHEDGVDLIALKQRFILMPVPG